jgi:hypothetical protein
MTLQQITIENNLKKKSKCELWPETRFKESKLNFEQLFAIPPTRSQPNIEN